ncbi:hypothetical protein [Rubellicoccus peritrichatus]|uniref:Uncharacterized protein n=1 Tax=Rubellicoccus peritrichatus TaxID=3080537 RepID=A0AAQ3QRP5_9BACT|nr:hypothetical protein [Puniceicoccus sp. CR14]WOO41498.1 hypothetical protein RZN69_00255 [Puniceicoccus sp. CR14]
MKTINIFILIGLGIILFGCAKENEDDPMAGESEYVKRQYSLFLEYKTGDPQRAKAALETGIQETKEAPIEDISAFWKLQSLAFDQTRLAMVEEHLGNIQDAENYRIEALQNINEWLVQGNREKIDYPKLLQSVVDADQEFEAPWHPQN